MNLQNANDKYQQQQQSDEKVAFPLRTLCHSPLGFFTSGVWRHVGELFGVEVFALPKILRDSRISCKALSRGLGDTQFYSLSTA
jgi:hypothetical protein